MESSRIKSPLDVNSKLDTKKLLRQDAKSFVVTISKQIDCLQSRYGLPPSFRNIKSEKILINGPPIIKTMIRDVTKESPVLKVKYLNTFKNEYWSIKDVSRLNNIISFNH